MKNIMFIAPPAAGKGTQAKLFSRKYNLVHISIGDILRNIAKEDTEIGHYIKEILSSGQLVKDEITYKLIEERLKEDDCKNGFVVEGFPRNLDQAIKFDEVLDHLNIELNYVIYINVDEKILEKRIVGRRVCSECGSIFNVNDPEHIPQVESECDNCHGKLFQRTDDNIDAFKTRLNTYKIKTEPILNYYKKEDVLKEVNGNGNYIEVFNRIDSIISGNK